MAEPAASVSRSLYERALEVMPEGASRNSAIRESHPQYASRNIPDPPIDLPEDFEDRHQ